MGVVIRRYTGSYQNGVKPKIDVTFYTPVFRRDVLWYGDVRPSVHPSVRPGLRPAVFRTFLLHPLTYGAEILHMTLF